MVMATFEGNGEEVVVLSARERPFCFGARLFFSLFFASPLLLHLLFSLFILPHSVARPGVV